MPTWPTWPATLPISTKSPSCRGSDFARSRKTCSPTIRTAIRAAPAPKAATRAAIRAAVCAADPCAADPRAAPKYVQLRHLRDPFPGVVTVNPVGAPLPTPGPPAYQYGAESESEKTLPRRLATWLELHGLVRLRQNRFPKNLSDHWG